MTKLWNIGTCCKNNTLLLMCIIFQYLERRFKSRAVRALASFLGVFSGVKFVVLCTCVILYRAMHTIHSQLFHFCPKKEKKSLQGDYIKHIYAEKNDICTTFPLLLSAFIDRDIYLCAIARPRSWYHFKHKSWFPNQTFLKNLYFIVIISILVEQVEFNYCYQWLECPPI